MSDLPGFMSEQHVAIMNERAKQSSRLRELCAALERDYLWLQEMHDGEHIHYWQLNFTRDRGFYFLIGKPQTEPDLTQRGQYSDMIRAIRQVAVTGEMGDPHNDFIGDTSIIETLADIFAAAREVCQTEAKLPDLNEVPEA